MSTLYKTSSLKTALAQASIYRCLRHYGAAKQLLTPFLKQHPQHPALHTLYQQIQQQLAQAPARQPPRLLHQPKIARCQRTQVSTQ